MKSKHTILSNKIELSLPPDFQSIQPESIAKAENGEVVPDGVWTNGEQTIWLSVQYLKEPLLPYQLPDFQKEIVDELEAENAKIRDNLVELIDQKTFGIVEYEERDGEDVYFNILASTSFEGRTLSIAFNGVDTPMSELQQLGRNIIRSIRFLSHQTLNTRVHQASSVGKNKKISIAASPKENLLVDTKVLSDKLKLMLPYNFQLMEKELLEMRYPISASRPKEVYMNREADISIAFNHTRDVAKPEDLPKIRDIYEAQFNRPTIDFVACKLRRGERNRIDFITIEFSIPTDDTKIYNLLYIAVLEERLLMTSFNCAVYHLPKWEKIGKQIMESIVLLPPSPSSRIVVKGVEKNENEGKIVVKGVEKNENRGNKIVIKSKEKK